jgi:hypothetical protein
MAFENNKTALEKNGLNRLDLGLVKQLELGASFIMVPDCKAQ